MDSDEKRTEGIVPDTKDVGELQISDAIDKLLANPELIASVASALGVKAKPSLPKTRTEEQAKESTESEGSPLGLKNTNNLAPVLALLSDPKLFSKNASPPDDDRSRFLCALKPYVNPHRQEAIDTMLQIARMSEIMKSLGRVSELSGLQDGKTSV